MSNRSSPVLNVMRRELSGYFSTPVAWVFIVIFLVMSGVFTFYIGLILRTGNRRPGTIFPVPSLVVPVPGAGHWDAAVG